MLIRQLSIKKIAALCDGVDMRKKLKQIEPSDITQFTLYIIRYLNIKMALFCSDDKVLDLLGKVA